MMGKITKGSNFGGCVDYVTRRKKDNPDGTTCNEWRIIDLKDVSDLEGRESLIASFEDNRALNPHLKNPVGHISLNFHADDKDKINDAKMVEIARRYMERMGIVDTPYIVVRHLDKDYPHCHIVFSRINNHAETISDKNDFERNKDICLNLTKEYGLHISENKRQTNINKLRGNEKIRYEIFNVVDAAWNDNTICTIEQFEAKLKASGVGVEYKLKRGTNIVQGLWYTRKGKRFPSSKIDRRYTYDSLVRAFKNSEQIRANIRGNTAPKYNPSNQVDKLQQKTVQSPQPSSPQEEQGFTGGGGITWPEYRAAHMDLPVQEALRRFRAIKRGQNPNTMTGGMHM